MENSVRKTNRIEKIYNGLESNKYITAIKEGMVLAIPAIMAGSIALLLKSLPIPAYQEFIRSLFNGALVNILDIINKSTMGLISLILLLTISYSYGKLIESENLTIYPTVALCSFIAFAMNRTEFFSYKIFESSWLFNAIIITLLSCVLLEKLSKIKLLKRNSYAEGADVNFNIVMRSILPAGLVILIFALLNIILTAISKGSNFQTLLADSITSLFSGMGRTFGSSILFIFLLHIMWFFGIHGGNILDEVAKNLFEAGINVNMSLIGAGQVPTEIASKTFFDTFVLFGGCGTLLCFVVAILIGSKRSNIRGLARLASSQVLFNINELVMFGIPVVFNPILLVPFLMTPIVLTSISYFAMYIGLIPLAVHQVEWTTPIILSGYVSTGSFAGSLLQLFNLVVGVLIYLPFIKIAQNRYFTNLKYDVDRLTAAVIENEQTGVNYSLLTRNDKLSSTAKTLASDLKNAVKRGQIMIYYQPQINYDGEIAGIEALLRWKHDIVGFVYPPLVIRLAEETGIMNELGHIIAETSIKELNIIDKICGNNIKLSINISPGQLNDKEFFNDIKSLLEKYNVGRNRLGLELTEQTALTCSPVILDRIDKIHDMGVFIIMDDFGMGHSSLMYLQNNHFDVVKLDGSLVRDMLINDRSCDIISSIVYLSKSLNFKIIAEYVETEEQKDKLKELGCYMYQGYLYSPAVPADELERYVSNGGCKG